MKSREELLKKMEQAEKAGCYSVANVYLSELANLRRKIVRRNDRLIKKLTNATKEV